MQPAPGMNIIRGDNAQGKTSLLEAVLFAATSKSHRTNQEQELVGHGSDGFDIYLDVGREDRDVKIEAHWYRAAKRFKVNGVALTRVSDILGKVNLVLFCPEDVDLVKGTAATRRRFLDMELSQLYPSYLVALQQYRQVLRQRNELLRADRPDADLLAVWDEQLDQYGAVLVQHRTAFLDELAAEAERAYEQIAHAEPLSLRYAPSIAPGTSIADTLERTRARDIRQRVTTRGPHRDDFDFLIDAQSARTYGSQGQQKSAALALKLAEMELIRGHTGEYPVLMLDEVLAELDDGRARRLFEAIGESVQCLVTTTDPASRLGVFGDAGCYFEMEGGSLARRQT